MVCTKCKAVINSWLNGYIRKQLDGRLFVCSACRAASKK